MNIPPTLLKEAEAAAKHILFKAQILKNGDDMMTHLYKQGWFDCLARLSEMSEGEFDKRGASLASIAYANKDPVIDIEIAFIEGARHQHALSQAVLLKARDEIARLNEIHKGCTNLVIQLDAERARCERMERALERIESIPCNPTSMTDARSQLSRIERTAIEALKAHKETSS